MSNLPEEKQSSSSTIHLKKRFQIKASQLLERLMLLFIILVAGQRIFRGYSTLFDSPINFLDLILKPGIIILFLFISSNPSKSQIDNRSMIGVILSFGAPLFYNQSSYFDLSSITYKISLANCIFYSCFLIYCYLVLGRNLSIFPGVRTIISSGPYKLVRHPIYSAYMHLALNYLAIFPSIQNVFITFLLITGLQLRSTSEEKLLQAKSDYSLRFANVGNKFFSVTLSAPILILLASVTRDIVLQNQSISSSKMIQFAYPVLSLDPRVYDDWSSVFIGNHIYPRLIQDESNPQLKFVATDPIITCDESPLIKEKSQCSLQRITFRFNSFDDCNGNTYLKDDFEKELREILRAKTWILPNFDFCSNKENSDVCLEGPAVSDVRRRLSSIYLRFGWSKTSSSSKRFGAGPYCLTASQNSSGAFETGTVVPQIDREPTTSGFSFYTSQDANKDFNFALYGSEAMLQSARKNIHTNTPIGYYLVTHKKYARTSVPWNTVKVKTSIEDHLNKQGVTSFETTGYMAKVLPSGSAIASSLSPIEKRISATIVLPDYLQECSQMAENLNIIFRNDGFVNIKAVCIDLVSYQRDHVWPLSGDGNFDAFLTPLSPGAPGRDALRFQYFSPDSLESYTQDYNNPDELFYLVGAGPSYVTVDGKTICDVRSNSMGLGNITVLDFMPCRN